MYHLPILGFSSSTRCCQRPYLNIFKVRTIPAVTQGDIHSFPVLKESDCPQRHEDAEEDSPSMVKETASLKKRRQEWQLNGMLGQKGKLWHPPLECLTQNGFALYSLCILLGIW